MVSLELLGSIEAFKGMDQSQLSKLQPNCQELGFNQGDKLFTEDDSAEHLWIVLEGRVDLRFELPAGRPTSEEHTVSSVDIDKRDPVAQTFGWSCFVPPYKMRLSAYCATDRTKILRISKKSLLKLFDEDCKMGYVFLTYLITVVGYRFHQFQDVVAKNIGESLMCGW